MKIWILSQRKYLLWGRKFKAVFALFYVNFKYIITSILRALFNCYCIHTELYLRNKKNMQKYIIFHYLTVYIFGQLIIAIGRWCKVNNMKYFQNLHSKNLPENSGILHVKYTAAVCTLFCKRLLLSAQLNIFLRNVFVAVSYTDKLQYFSVRLLSGHTKPFYM